MKPIKAWGGFSDDKLDTTLEYYGNKPIIFSVYKNKTSAKKCYEDVREVTISFPKKPTKKMKPAWKELAEKERKDCPYCIKK